MTKIVVDLKNRTFSFHGHNSKAVSEKRMEFIRAKFPEVLKCDPYQSPALLARIREAMVQDGFYSQGKYKDNHAMDETLIKYILKIQGKNIRSRCRKPAREVFYGY